MINDKIASGSQQDFYKVATNLAIHMHVGEDEIFFPAIKRAAETRKAGSTPDPKDKETIKNSVLSISDEHDEIGDANNKIRYLSNGFSIPGDVCNTFVIISEI
ncbi:MAG: hypothetical protein HQM08_21875 [Candidatus Riflebacteria bacterium]|nr:hypothetical protein [Candidatus Riflebacteria bacterium]